jgi:hypothetical protein
MQDGGTYANGGIVPHIPHLSTGQRSQFHAQAIF